MHKGIYLSLTLWVEGEDEPAHDFSRYTMQAIQQMLAAGKTAYPQLQVEVRSIEEDTNEGEDRHPDD